MPPQPDTAAVAHISNPFSTGGGGVNYERHVQAFFLFKMISRDLCPLLGMPIRRMDFQAKYLGYDTDDLVVTAASGPRTARLLCQIKHDVTVSSKNGIFRDVIAAAWSDFQKPDFDPDADQIALIAAGTGKQGKHAMAKLRSFARDAGNADDFMFRLHTANFSANAVRDAYDAIQDCIGTDNDFEVWRFLKCFSLYLLDLEPGGGNSLYDTLRSAIRAHALQDPDLVWSKLSEQCGAWNQRAASVTYDHLPDSIASLFASEAPETEIEQYLDAFPTLDYSNECIPFAYDYAKLADIWGRDAQLEQLRTFTEETPQRFSFCVITGPAGIGKSKLVFHFGHRYQEKKNWLVRKAVLEDIPELTRQTNWNSGRNILLIIDYANEQEELGRLLRTLSRVKDAPAWGKIRLILIAREGAMPSQRNASQFLLPQWYERMVKRDRGIHQHLFGRDFINLQGLSRENCAALYGSFTDNHLHIRATEADRTRVLDLIDRAVTDEDHLVRPLYALFVMDLYHSNPHAKKWDLPYLQKQIYDRDKERWRGELNDEDLFRALLNLLLYATIFDGWESDQPLPPPLADDCRTIFDAARISPSDCKATWFKMLTGHVVRRNGTPVLPRLTPDMVGEFFVLNELDALDAYTRRQWELLILARFADCREFFIRAIQDFGNEETYIDVFRKLFDDMIGLLENGDETAHRVFSSILETFYRNYKGNEKDHIFTGISATLEKYIERYRDLSVSAAELELLFHENRPGIGREKRLEHFTAIEPLHTRWPGSRRIASRYIDFLGALAAGSLSAHEAGYQDEYIKQFIALHGWIADPDEEIRRAFLPALIAVIQSANGIMDWDTARHLEEDFLRKIMADCSEELCLDFISRFDQLIIDLARQRINTLSALDPEQPEYHAVKQAFDQRLVVEISFYKEIIARSEHPSFNFIWTYVTTLPKITKGLFIYENPSREASLESLEPVLQDLFLYMLDKLKTIYNTCRHARDNSALARHASHTLNMFCESKSSAIPYPIKAMCILRDPD